MPFDNFYKAADKITRQQTFLVGLVIFILFSLALLCTSGKLKRSKPVESKPSDSVRMLWVEKICYEVPKPEQFVLVDKSSLISSYSIEVTYKYKTERSFEEIAPNFYIWASANGWQRTSSGGWIEFQKRNQFVTIVNDDFATYNYTITCADKD